MEKHRLDIIELKQMPGTNSYTVKGYCNLGGGGIPVTKPAILSQKPEDKDLIVNVDNIKSSQPLTFETVQGTGINFDTKYGRRDYLCLVFQDNVSNTFPLLDEVAGVVIKDTDYPPPYNLTAQTKDLFLKSRHRELSEKFKIDELKATRINQTEEFDVAITLSFDRSVSDFSFVSAAQVQDTLRQGSSDLGVIHLNEQSPTSGTGSISIVFRVPTGLKNLARGFPIIIKSDQIGLADFDTKKALLFID